MTKTEAFALLGGSATSAAIRIGISVQAVAKWPDKLPDRLRDRVEAVLWREHVAGLAVALETSKSALEHQQVLEQRAADRLAAKRAAAAAVAEQTGVPVLSDIRV